MFKILFGYIKKQPFKYMFLNLAVVINAVIFNLTPYFFAQILSAASYGDTDRIIKYLGVIAGILIFTTIFWEFGCASVIVRIYADVLVSAKSDAIKALQNMDYQYHTSKSTGKIISKLGKFDNALFWFLYGLNMFMLNKVIALILPVIIIFKIAPSVSYAMVILLALFGPIFFLLLKNNFKWRTRANEQENKYSDVVVDNLIAFDTVKAFAKEGKELDRIGRQLALFGKTIVRADISYRFLYGGVRMIGVIVSVIGIIMTINLYKEGFLDIGGLALIIGYVLYYSMYMTDFAFNLREVVKASSDMKNFSELLMLKPTIVNSTNAKEMINPRGGICFKDVGFKYDKDEAVRDIDFIIKPKERVAFIGPSGSGKTTIAKLIMRYYDAQRGEIKIDGENIKDVKLESLRKIIGIVPQDPVMFNDTVLFNVGYALEKPNKTRIIEACKLAQIHEFIESLPEGYDTVIGERGIKLSGGQRQRLAIARMILKQPQILIFDEATSQLDSESEKLIHNALKVASKDKTTLIIAHRLSTVVDCDRIYVVNKGVIDQVGTHNELLKGGGLYKKLWEIQSSGFISTD